MAQKTTPESQALLPIEQIASRIILLRGQKIMLDADLARLYGVTTKRLNEQVKRNIDRFPADFMFQLRGTEKKKVVAICDHLRTLKYSPGRPYAFTEHGALMAASVLNTPRAVEVSVFVVRAFIRLRELLASNQVLARKLDQLERRLGRHDEAIAGLVQAIRQLMAPPVPARKRPIGFAPWPRE